ncbi:MAG: hypothetical protein R3C12_11155 [Planctomycetaceae bacterium]
MEERYDLLARTGVRQSESYNSLGKAEVLKRPGMASDAHDAEQIPEQMPLHCDRRGRNGGHDHDVRQGS